MGYKNDMEIHRPNIKHLHCIIMYYLKNVLFFFH